MSLMEISKMKTEFFKMNAYNTHELTIRGLDELYPTHSLVTVYFRFEFSANGFVEVFENNTLSSSCLQPCHSQSQHQHSKCLVNSLNTYHHDQIIHFRWNLMEFYHFIHLGFE